MVSVPERKFPEASNEYSNSELEFNSPSESYVLLEPVSTTVTSPSSLLPD